MSWQVPVNDNLDLSTQKGNPMRCLLAALLAVGLLCPLLGCGGTITQADMRRHAIRRSRNTDEETEPATTARQGRQDAVVEALTNGEPAQRQPHKVDRGSAPEPAPQPTPAGVKEPKTKAADVLPATEEPTRPAAVAQPAQPLTPIERRQRSLDNLAQIGEAIRRYTQEKKQIFAPAKTDVSGRPTLSWRVELLPYLGYQALHDRFHLNEPWNSPHNRALLPQIPAPYQSPERFDENTNYLLPKASFTPFSNNTRGMSLSTVEDGPADTVAVVEVDEAFAVPWTKPADLELALHLLPTQVGTLREDGFFVVWLDGSVGRILPQCDKADLRAIFSYDTGDSYAAYATRGEATAVPVLVEPEAPSAKLAASNTSAGHADPTAPEPAAPAEPAPTAAPPPAVAARPAKFPVPDPLSMEQARKLARELYQEEYASQKDANQQRALAQRILRQAREIKDDPAGQYVLLEIALKIATRVGDTPTAISAVEQLVGNYTVDELEMTHETLVALVKKGRDGSGSSQVLTKARGLIDQAIREEQFETAESLCQIAAAAARQLGDRDAASQLVSQAAFVAECQKAFKDVQRILTSAKDADDPEGNLRVGRYYCLIRGEWEKGLPLLAKGSHTRLRELAEAEMAGAELADPMIPADQLKLADGWWELGTSDAAHQAALYRRAAFWYQRVLPELPTGLWRAKADMRLKEFRRLYGPVDVASVGE